MAFDGRDVQYNPKVINLITCYEIKILIWWYVGSKLYRKGKAL